MRCLAPGVHHVVAEMSAVMGSAVGREVSQALKLPQRTVWAEIRFAAGEVVSVRCEHFPSRDDVGELTTILKRYELTEPQQESEELRAYRRTLVPHWPTQKRCTHARVSSVNDFLLDWHSRFDVGHEMVLPERAMADHR